MTFETGSGKIFPLIAMIGAIIGIIAVFIAWYTVSAFGISFSMTGWDFINDGIIKNTYDIEYFVWMPLIVLISSIIALIVGLVDLLAPNKALGALLIAMGVLTIVATIIFMTYSSHSMNMIDHLGIGVYLSIISGVVVMIPGVLGIKNG